MFHSHHTVLCVWLTIGCVLAVGATPTVAQTTIDWTHTGTGLFHEGANWSTLAAPGTLDTARFNTGGTPTVQWDATTGNTVGDDLLVEFGDVTLESIGGSIYTHTASFVTINNRLTLSQFDLSASTSLSVTGGGAMNVRAGGSASALFILSIGSSGKGILTLEAGGSLSSANATLGNNKGSEGVVIVKGTGSTWNSSGYIRLGSSGADGVLNILDGGSVSSGDGVLGTAGFGSVGVAKVSGPGSSWTVTSGLTVGSSPAGMGMLTIESGGSVSSVDGIVGLSPLLGVATVTGAGSIWSNSGNITVGSNGTLNINNEATLTSDSIDIHGALAVAFNSAPAGLGQPVTATGAATLGGTLSVSFASGFVPNLGDEFQIISAGSINGSFNAVLLPTIPGMGLSLLYSPTTVSATAGLLGDLNLDGFVGVDDLNIVLGNWNLNVAPGEWGAGDLSGDGFVGVDDLNTVLAHWNANSPPVSSTEIPEPASFALLGLGGLALIRRNGRSYKPRNLRGRGTHTRSSSGEEYNRNNRSMSPLLKMIVACVGVWVVVSTTETAMAVPYASSITMGDDTVSFILNEPADAVTITRDGGSAIVLNAASDGGHTFDMTGFSSYSIEVTHSALTGWVQSPSSVDNPFLVFERANGLAVNNNPASSNFGRFYVSHRAATLSLLDRLMGDGIYVFKADATDAFGITDPNDTRAARSAGLDFTSSSNSPFRITVGSDDTLYISDWSDIHGGIYHTDADVSTGGTLLAGLGGVRPIVGQNHGSIISTPIVSGSLAGGDLVLYTIDEDLEGSAPNTGNHVWRYDIGGTDDYAGTGTLALDASTLGTNSDGSAILLDSNAGIDADITRDPRTGNFIITQPNNVSGTGLLIMDPTFSNVLFNSRQFTIDNNTSDVIFRNAGSAKVSPDGSVLAVRNLSVVVLIPLDPDGLPILDIADEFLGTEFFAAPSGLATFRVPVAYDLAGNIYSAGNFAERAAIYGPGGDTTAITKSDGTFTINGLCYGDACPSIIVGDLNADGFVGVDDLNIVLVNWNQNVDAGVWLQGDPTGEGFVGVDDLNIVLVNWNNGTPPGTPSDMASPVIPEPGTLALLGLGALSLPLRRRWA